VTDAAISCPFCDSEQVELVSPWAGQLITSQMRCRDCNTYFEAVRDDQLQRASYSWTSSSDEDR
jgi:C4-type Zn-finger protein